MSCDPAFRIRTYQMVRAITLRNVVGAEYPKDRLFNAFAPAAAGRRKTASAATGRKPAGKSAARSKSAKARAKR